MPTEIRFTITDRNDLSHRYLTMIVNGGILLPVEQELPLGSAVTVYLLLPEQSSPLHFEGKVVWLTPANKFSNTLAKVGVQFMGKNTEEIRTQIENIIAGTFTSLKSKANFKESIKA